jgi:hypothetical protein
MWTYCSILSEFVFQPPADPSRIVAAGALLAALGLAVYWRTAALSRPLRTLLGGLRLLVLALLVGILLGPSALRWVSEQNYRRKLVVAMDTSCSFGTKDVDGRSRFEAARQAWLDPKLINALRNHFDLRFYRYDERLAATGLGPLWEMTGPEGRQTCIGSAVRRLLETEFAHEVEPAGILLIGDGHETGAGDPVGAAQAAGQLGVPIWTSCLGGPAKSRDVALVTPSGQESLFTNQTGRITAKLVQSGFDPEEVQVALLREGKPVQQQPVALRGRAVSDVAFDIREDRPGLYEYEVRTEPLAGEADTTNNSRCVFVRVSNEKIKVLLVETQPYWDTKFLAQCLRADPQMELTQIVRYGRTGFTAIRAATTRPAGGNEPGEQTVLLPRTKADLFQYDVLIFGKGLPAFLPPERMGLLKEYLDERGGGIVFARGRPYDPAAHNGAEAAQSLSALEPAVWGEDYVRELQIELTPAGRVHPSFQFAGKYPPDLIVKELPGMIGAVRVRKEKAAALVLARSQASGTPPTADDAPTAAVAYENYGKGRVVSILSEGLWRWSLLPAKYQQFEKIAPFDQFWRQMVRWLATGADFLPGQDVALTIAQFPENLGDTAQIEVRLKCPPQAATSATLTATGPGGQSQPLPLDRANEDGGVLRSSFEAKKPGVYRVMLRTPQMTPPQQETRFCVYDYSVETIDTSADPTTMREIAEASGGQYLDASAPRRLLGLLERKHPVRQAQREVEFIWDRPSVFAGIVGLLAIEWFIRRRRGVA